MSVMDIKGMGYWNVKEFTSQKNNPADYMGGGTYDKCQKRR